MRINQEFQKSKRKKELNFKNIMINLKMIDINFNNIYIIINNNFK